MLMSYIHQTSLTYSMPTTPTHYITLRSSTAPPTWPNHISLMFDHATLLGRLLLLLLDRDVNLSHGPSTATAAFGSSTRRRSAVLEFFNHVDRNFLFVLARFPSNGRFVSLLVQQVGELGPLAEFDPDHAGGRNW